MVARLQVVAVLVHLWTILCDCGVRSCRSQRKSTPNIETVSLLGRHNSTPFGHTRVPVNHDLFGERSVLSIKSYPKTRYPTTATRAICASFIFEKCCILHLSRTAFFFLLPSFSTIVIPRSFLLPPFLVFLLQ